MSDIVERMQEIFLTGTVSDCSASDCGDASLEVIKLRALCDSVQKERDQAVLDLEMAEDRICALRNKLSFALTIPSNDEIMFLTRNAKGAAFWRQQGYSKKQSKMMAMLQKIRNRALSEP